MPDAEEEIEHSRYLKAELSETRAILNGVKESWSDHYEDDINYV